MTSRFEEVFDQRAGMLFKGGSGPPFAERGRILADLRVGRTPAGTTMGLEPVWKSHRVVLVSDTGGLMDAEAGRNVFWRIKRYPAIREARDPRAIG